MQIKALALLSFMFLTLLLQAQTYDVSQYKARFDRRPLLEFTPSFSYNSSFTNEENADQHNVNLGIKTFWQEQSNRDNRIQNIAVRLDANYGRQIYENPNFKGVSNRGVLFSVSVEQVDFLKGKKFWGLRGDALVNIRSLDNEMQVANTATDVSLKPGIFFGYGRIEFAEDAMLANWIMDDLLEDGVIASATPEQRESLALRITSIVGNRTFDFRRRRIYELKQLKELFAEEQIAHADDFMLFAILNDNWALTNRATLPHGTRWQFGVDGGGHYTYRSLFMASDDFLLEGRPYINFRSARIKHNNASSVWGAEIDFFYENYSLDPPAIPSFRILDLHYGGTARLSYEYIWLPVSRTMLRWQNQFTAVLSTSEYENAQNEEIQNYRLDTGLRWDYFIAYNWRFVLAAGITGDWREQAFKSHNVRPFINFSTRYSLFDILS